MPPHCGAGLPAGLTPARRWVMMRIGEAIAGSPYPEPSRRGECAMPLDPKQHAKAEAWLNKHLKGKPCPVCTRSSWLVHNAINGLPDITGGALPTAGHVTMYGV